MNACFLLAVLSISVLPLSLLHRHEGNPYSPGIVQTSSAEGLLANAELDAAPGQGHSHVSASQIDCLFCQYTFIHHYLPAPEGKVLRVSLSAEDLNAEIPVFPALFTDFRPLRAPPAC